jgi:hypothetical protein
MLRFLSRHDSSMEIELKRAMQALFSTIIEGGRDPA